MTPLTPLGIQKLTVQMPDSLQGVGTGAELVTKPRPLGSRPGRSPAQREAQEELPFSSEGCWGSEARPITAT